MSKQSLGRSKAKPEPEANVEAAFESWQAGPSPAEGLSATARHILDVAEQLFARHGIEKVSFRDLVAASEQRNISAVAYHFGTRAGLIEAMLSRRMWQLNKTRMQRLQALLKAGTAGDVHAVVGDSFRVLADVIRQEPWGRDFALILAQVLFHPEMDFDALIGGELSNSNEMARLLVRKAMPELASQAFEHRAEMAYNQGIYALAMWVQRHGPVTEENSTEYEAFVRNSVDFLAGGVMAPVSVKRARARR